MNKLTTKQLGDAGEYYALSQFIFAGKAAAKMPDNWPEYDIALDFNGELKKVSVKTRMTKSSFSTEHCKFNDNEAFNFLVLIFISSKDIRSWVIPADVAKKEGKKPSIKNPHYCRLSFKQLIKLGEYEDNWALENE